MQDRIINNRWHLKVHRRQLCNLAERYANLQYNKSDPFCLNQTIHDLKHDYVDAEYIQGMCDHHERIRGQSSTLTEAFNNA